MSTAELVKKPNGSTTALSTPMELLAFALQNNAAIDVIERLAVLQERAMAAAAEYDFNEAMMRAQKTILMIAPDLRNEQTNSSFASYAALDKVVRPVYVEEGFNLSFDTDDAPRPDCVRVVCYVSRGGHTRKYKVDVPADGKGAKGGDVMTKTHATGAAMSYGQRYLIKFIFNLAIGKDLDGNSPKMDDLDEQLEWIANASDEAELRRLFAAAYKKAGALKDQQALKAVIAAKDNRLKDLR